MHGQQNIKKIPGYFLYNASTSVFNLMLQTTVSVTPQKTSKQIPMYTVSHVILSI